ncbi:MAG: hypothetical protein ACFBQW_02405 [Sphingomonadaceae bacterium]
MNGPQHLLVLMSIVLGLAIRELLVGLRVSAPLIRDKTVGILPLAAGLLVLIIIVQFWWYLYGVSQNAGWTLNFFLFAAVFFRAALLFLSASSVFPTLVAGRPPGEHYMHNRGWIYVPILIYEGQNLAESAYRLETLLHPAHLFHLIFMLLALIAAVSSRPRVHIWVLGLGYLLFLVFVAAFNLRLY